MSASAAPHGASTSNDILSGLPRYCSTELEVFTYLELTLIEIGGAIRNKKNWIKKIGDAVIVDKWIAEATEMKGVPPNYMNYVVQELKFWAQKFPGPVAPATVPGVYMADDALPEDLMAELLVNVRRLETEEEPDWHPGSNEQVRDLVHPSLYPTVFGTSLVLPDDSPPLDLDTCLSSIGRGIPTVPSRKTSMYSTKFQWLPAIFNVDSEGTVEVQSYINNLHPLRYKAAYPVLARIFARLLPLFNLVLTDLLNPRPPAIKVDPYAWYGEAPEFSDDEKMDDYYETRVPQYPPVPETFTPPPEPTKVVDLRGRKLQVIVKLASIHLTPEKPSYPGGAWHIEGMRNESIIATAIVYYSQENITESNLAFRMAVTEIFDYEQNDRRGVSFVYGLEDEAPLNQFLGRVTSIAGRAICFPNTLQHQVQPFELVDKEKAGHRKILVFWLVDPSREMKLTSENVPPQQLEWFKEEVFSEGSEAKPNWLADIPDAARDVVEKKMEAGYSCPYSREKAKEYREELMKERKFVVNEQNEELYERPLSLCEH